MPYVPDVMVQVPHKSTTADEMKHPKSAMAFHKFYPGTKYIYTSTVYTPDHLENVRGNL